MLLSLSYGNAFWRNATLKYNSDQELVLVDYRRVEHKVVLMQVLVVRPDPSPFAQGLFEQKWIDIDFNVDSGILTELIQKNVPLVHSPPARFYRGGLFAQVDEDGPRWTLFGHTDVIKLKILYSS